MQRQMALHLSSAEHPAAWLPNQPQLQEQGQSCLSPGMKSNQFHNHIQKSCNKDCINESMKTTVQRAMQVALTRRSACVIPGPPFRGILSPPDTSITERPSLNEQFYICLFAASLSLLHTIRYKLVKGLFFNNKQVI